MRVEEVISQKALIDYSRAFPVENYAFSALFPTRRVDDLEFDWMKGAYNRPASAHFHAFDTETEYGHRYGYTRNTAGLELIKRKYRLNEREIMKIRTPRTSYEQQYAIDYIYDDITKLRQSIEVRVERMRAEVLSTGKLKINENGYVAAEVDYGVPKKHQGELKWTDENVDVLDDLFNIRNTIRDDSDTEVLIERVIMPEKWLFYILKNKQVRAEILGLEKDRFLTQAELNQGLSRMNLPTIVTDDRKYVEETVKNGKLVRTPVRYLPDDKIIFIPGGTLGETVRGTTPEAMELRSDNVANVEQMGDITLTSWREKDPVGYFVKASSTAGLSFPYADEIYIGTAKSE